jgi:hypothetical protein
MFHLQMNRAHNYNINNRRRAYMHICQVGDPNVKTNGLGKINKSISLWIF